MFNENYWEDVLEANEDLRRINSRLEANVTYLNKELEEKKFSCKCTANFT